MSAQESDVGELTGENLVFIIGCPRSGTTWLQRLLATHPQVKTGQESRVFEYIDAQSRLWRQDLASVAIGRGGVGLACYFTGQEFLAVQKQYLRLLLAPMLDELKPGQVFLEKTPSHALFVPEIIKFLPQAKFIHVVRDPRDVAASLLAASRSWGRKWAPRKAGKAVRRWWQHVSAAQAAALPETQYQEIRYEILHREPATVLRSLSQFLKLSWEDNEILSAIEANMAEELRQGRGTSIPLGGEHGKNSHGTVQEPEGFVRKARPGVWRKDLTRLERWRVWWELRNIGPAWKKYAWECPEVTQAAERRLKGPGLQ